VFIVMKLPFPVPLPPYCGAFAIGAAVSLVRTEQVDPLPPVEPLELGVAMKARMTARIAHITPAAMMLAMAGNALVVIAPPIRGAPTHDGGLVSSAALTLPTRILGTPCRPEVTCPPWPQSDGCPRR
jgi:hypothetical protein